MRFISIAIILVLQTYTVIAQKSTSTAIDKKLDSIFSSFNEKTPGFAVIVLENGKVTAKKVYGMASIELKVPFTHNTVCRMPYSEAREFIAIAAVLMENDGLLNLQDKVRNYFPKLPEWSSNVTILDLMNHRSGFMDEWSAGLAMHADMANRFDVSQFLTLLYNQPEPEVEPGKGYMYCNSDYGLLRLILEKASGKNLSDWLKQRVFDPLQMTGTLMQNEPLQIIPSRASEYVATGNNRYRMNHNQKTSPGGNYFILTTADNLQKWAVTLNDPGNEFAAASTRLIEITGSTPDRKNHRTVGYTLETIKNEKAILHEGVSNNTYITRVPSKAISIITFGNAFHNNKYWQEAITDIVLKVKPPAKLQLITTPISLTDAQLKEFEGIYSMPDDKYYQSEMPSRRRIRITAEDGKLNVVHTQIVQVFTPVGKDVFYNNDGMGSQLKFSRSNSGRIEGAIVKWEDGYTIRLAPDTTTLWKPTKDELSEFVGRYYSKHFDYYFTILFNEEGEFIVRRPTVADVVIHPERINEFRLPYENRKGNWGVEWLQFFKDKDGKVTHFNRNEQRLMKNRFDKVE
jgi:CubicO group peptidase (beta-lactamase class C family)